MPVEVLRHGVAIIVVCAAAALLSACAGLDALIDLEDTETQQSAQTEEPEPENKPAEAAKPQPPCMIGQPPQLMNRQEFLKKFERDRSREIAPLYERVDVSIGEQTLAQAGPQIQFIYPYIEASDRRSSVDMIEVRGANKASRQLLADPARRGALTDLMRGAVRYIFGRRYDAEFTGFALTQTDAQYRAATLITAAHQPTLQTLLGSSYSDGVYEQMLQQMEDGGGLDITETAAYYMGSGWIILNPKTSKDLLNTIFKQSVEVGDVIFTASLLAHELEHAITPQATLQIAFKSDKHSQSLTALEEGKAELLGSQADNIDEMLAAMGREDLAVGRNLTEALAAHGYYLTGGYEDYVARMQAWMDGLGIDNPSGRRGREVLQQFGSSFLAESITMAVAGHPEHTIRPNQCKRFTEGVLSRWNTSEKIGRILGKD